MYSKYNAINEVVLPVNRRVEGKWKRAMPRFLVFWSILVELGF
jgi:hypothetical protein